MAAQYLILMRGAKQYFAIIHQADTIEELRVSLPPDRLVKITLVNGQTCLVNASGIDFITGPNNGDDEMRHILQGAM